MPGIERIQLGGLEGLRVGRFKGPINTSCIVYRLGDTVIDVGPPNQWKAVRSFLEEREARRVVVTHYHEDHAGNLARVAERGPEALAPALSLEPLRRGHFLRPYQLVIWGRARRAEAGQVPAEIPLRGGGRLEAVATPGHSDDSTCYLERERGWLFSGDLFISSRTKYLRKDESLPDQIASLETALELDFETLLCSHRGVIEDGKGALRRKLDFLKSLCEEVADLHAQGLDARRITRRLLGREDGMTWWTGWHFSKRNLVKGCLAYAAGTRRARR